MMKEWLDGAAFQREQVKLAPGEEAPQSLTHYVAPSDGFRWENDDEFRKRIARDMK